MAQNANPPQERGEGRRGARGFGGPIEHAYLKQHDVPHTWHVASHGHDAAEWKQALYYFAQKLFK